MTLKFVCMLRMLCPHQSHTKRLRNGRIRSNMPVLLLENDIGDGRSRAIVLSVILVIIFGAPKNRSARKSSVKYNT